MKAKLPRLLLLLAAGLALGIGCAKARSDTQVASDAQSKIGADHTIANKQQISVQAAKGVVTLSGLVATDAERNAAANDAAAVEGVKTVVNNLTVQPPQVAQAQPAAPVQGQPAPTPEPAREPSHKAKRRHESRPAAVSNSQSAKQPDNQAMATNAPAMSTPAQPVTPAAPVAPAPPPPPAKLTIPGGTQISIRLSDGLDSERNRTGDTFRAALNAPVVVDDKVAIPANAEVQGHVVDVQSAGRFAGAAKLAITLDRISYRGHSYPIQTDEWTRQSTGRGKNTAAKVGGGAALGAIIGGLAGGGKGAGIGTVVGAGAGTGVQGATRGQQIKLSPEALVSFQLRAPISVTPSAGSNRRELSTE